MRRRRAPRAAAERRDECLSGIWGDLPWLARSGQRETTGEQGLRHLEGEATVTVFPLR